MADYDFHQLSPHDFERMSRDLLQADWGVMLESFKTGKDSGTDFRYAQGGALELELCSYPGEPRDAVGSERNLCGQRQGVGS
jgi:hypothetical protein